MDCACFFEAEPAQSSVNALRKALEGGLYAGQGQLSDKFSDPSAPDSTGHLYMTREDIGICAGASDFQGRAEA